MIIYMYMYMNMYVWHVLKISPKSLSFSSEFVLYLRSNIFVHLLIIRGFLISSFSSWSWRTYSTFYIHNRCFHEVVVTVSYITV